MLPFRRQRTLKRRVTDAARQAPKRGRELRRAASELDIKWARSMPARFVRERFMQFVLNPVMDYYAARRATGSEKLKALKEPVILVANHASHMDTPVILSALPRKLRKKTAVAAAADYFYRNKLTASIVSLIFNTVPIDRKRGTGVAKDGSHLDTLLDEGWNLLLFPEGTRSRGGGPGKVRRGAAVLAAAHGLSIIPIRVTGTADAMPPGRIWPKRLRLRGRPLSKRHRITVSFGEPIPPVGDVPAMIERVQSFFDSTDGGGPSMNPYRRRSEAKADAVVKGPGSSKGASKNITKAVAHGATGLPEAGPPVMVNPASPASPASPAYSSSSSSQSVVRATALRHFR